MAIPTSVPHALTLTAALLALLVFANLVEVAWRTGALPVTFIYGGCLLSAAAIGQLIDDVRTLTRTVAGIATTVDQHASRSAR